MSRALGVLLLLFLVPLALFVLSGPPSASGAAYVLAPVVLASALVVPERLTKRVALAGLALLILPAIWRIAFTKHGGDVRVVDRVIEERDLSVDASRVIARTHFMSDPDVPLLPDAMRSAYDDMEREQGSLPSPVVATYAGLERSGASDTIEFDHDGSDAIVFLHGYAGNFTLSCWLFARAAARAGMATSCPSTSWRGDWWTTPSERIVRDTIASLRSRGKKRIFLAGLSNGGIGASRLAPRLRREIAGLVLVSGAAPDAAAPGVPTLVVQGRRDAQISASVAYAYAQRAGAEYDQLDDGHFALLVDRERAAHVIAEWLGGRSRI
ncbi:MAG TPA: alpha/beta hydrolase [Polyangiaceae bacterium]